MTLTYDPVAADSFRYDRGQLNMTFTDDEL